MKSSCLILLSQVWSREWMSVRDFGPSLFLLTLTSVLCLTWKKKTFKGCIKHLMKIWQEMMHYRIKIMVHYHALMIMSSSPVSELLTWEFHLILSISRNSSQAYFTFLCQQTKCLSSHNPSIMSSPTFCPAEFTVILHVTPPRWWVVFLEQDVALKGILPTRDALASWHQTTPITGREVIGFTNQPRLQFIVALGFMGHISETDGQFLIVGAW